MLISNISQQPYDASINKKRNEEGTKQDAGAKAAQTARVEAATESVDIRSGYDLTKMTSDDMLALANSLHNEGNNQAFLTLAVLSARAALEDHPDPLVSHTWVTPRNEDGTFNLLAEIMSPIHVSTGSSEHDKEQLGDLQNLLDSLLSLPDNVIKMESTSIDIKL